MTNPLLFPELTALKGVPFHTHDGEPVAAASVSADSVTITGIQAFADNAAAITGGLTAGDLYHTAGAVKVVT